MKRRLLLLCLPILACSILSSPASPISAPFTLPTVASAAVTDTAVAQTPSLGSQPATAIPTVQNPPSNTNSFPNVDQFEWRQIVSGLNRPVDVQPVNDHSGRLFIIEKYGAIRVFENGQLLETPFLNIDSRVDDSGNEMGLLGLVFDPNYGQNGFFYVNYTGDGGNTRISRFHAEGDVADPGSETVLLKVNQPFPNHNGGVLTFGPDGYLYAGLGDGGAAGDPFKNAQNTNRLLGKILRIDVHNGDPYSIPSDNPFGNEVWAYGLRNPWRISFDRATGDLWIGDVGQGDWEEIDYLPAGSAGGSNFGWSIMEGSHGYDGDAGPALLLPVAEYPHSQGGCSVTGGYVYRGSMTEWDGIYLYGDYCSGKIWGLLLSNGNWQSQLLFESGLNITSFGQDESGEIYLAGDGGSVYILERK